MAGFLQQLLKESLFLHILAAISLEELWGLVTRNPLSLFRPEGEPGGVSWVIEDNLNSSTISDVHEQWSLQIRCCHPWIGANCHNDQDRVLIIVAKICVSVTNRRFHIELLTKLEAIHHNEREILILG